MTDTLGMALASIASTTDPEMFMVGGGVARAGDVLFNPLREHFKTYAFSSCRETPIVAATLGNDLKHLWCCAAHRGRIKPDISWPHARISIVWAWGFLFYKKKELNQ